MSSSRVSARAQDAGSRTGVCPIDPKHSARSRECVAGRTSPAALQEDAPPGVDVCVLLFLFILRLRLSPAIGTGGFN